MLYERLLGMDDRGLEVDGPIGVSFFHALLTEVARGELAKALRVELEQAAAMGQ